MLGWNPAIPALQEALANSQNTIQSQAAAIAKQKTEISSLKEPVDALQKTQEIMAIKLTASDSNFANLSLLTTDLNNRFRDVTTTQSTQLTKINQSEARVIALENQLRQEKIEKQVLNDKLKASDLLIANLDKMVKELLERLNKVEAQINQSDTISEASAPTQNRDMGDFFTGEDDTKSDT